MQGAFLSLFVLAFRLFRTLTMRMQRSSEPTRRGSRSGRVRRAGRERMRSRPTTSRATTARWDSPMHRLRRVPTDLFSVPHPHIPHAHAHSKLHFMDFCSPLFVFPVPPLYINLCLCLMHSFSFVDDVNPSTTMSECHQRVSSRNDEGRSAVALIALSPCEWRKSDTADSSAFICLASKLLL
jgi:hypothetical protein